MPEDFANLDVDLPVIGQEGDGMRVILPGEEGCIRIALGQILRCVTPLDLNVEERGTLELVVAEALNNIVEHAYADYSGVLEVSLNRMPDGLHVEIVDGGIEMPDGQMPLGKLIDYPEDPEEMPEGGFGWFLIHDLAHELTYAREDDRNILKFRLALGATGNS